MKLENYFNRFSKTTQISNVMKLRPVGAAELFHADRHAMTKLKVAFAEASTNEELTEKSCTEAPCQNTTQFLHVILR